jgi:hypothetical protein
MKESNVPKLNSNVLSAPVFLECRSAPASYQKKEWHSHIAPFEKGSGTPSSFFHEKSALFYRSFLKFFLKFFLRFFSH